MPEHVLGGCFHNQFVGTKKDYIQHVLLDNHYLNDSPFREATL